MHTPPKVFVSYSHDNPTHENRVLALADALRTNGGMETILDAYFPAPEEGWPLWMERNIQTCDFVLLVCTPTYLKRWDNTEAPDKGKGVGWEAHIVRNLFYAMKSHSTQFIPILLLPDGKSESIPLVLREHTHYSIKNFDLADSEYENLIRHLTGQAATPPPPPGTIPVLPPRRP